MIGQSNCMVSCIISALRRAVFLKRAEEHQRWYIGPPKSRASFFRHLSNYRLNDRVNNSLFNDINYQTLCKYWLVEVSCQVKIAR